MSIDNLMQENRMYQPNKSYSILGKLKNAFDYAAKTSVTQTTRDLTDYMKEDYRQTKEHVKAAFDPLKEFGAKTAAAIQGYMNRGQPQLAFAAA